MSHSDRTLSDILSHLDWEVVLDLGGFDLTASPDGIHVAFDSGGIATLVAVDGRYATVRSAQVSGVARADTHNGLMVVVTSPTTGELARRAFGFEEWLGTVEVSSGGGVSRARHTLELHKVGHGWGWWAGGKPYREPVFTDRVCRAVLQFLMLHGTTELVEAL